MAGTMRTVVGVMPMGFDFPSEDVLLWIPNGLDTAGAAISPGQFGLRLVARVRPGVEPEALIAQLELIASRLPEQYGGPTTYAEIIERFVPRVVPLKEELLGPLEGPLWILLGAMSILLAHRRRERGEPLPRPRRAASGATSRSGAPSALRRVPSCTGSSSRR